MSDIQSSVNSIVSNFENADVDLDESDVSDRLSQLVNDYKVPLADAEQSVKKHYLNANDLEAHELYETAEYTIEELREKNEDGVWATVGPIEFVDEKDPFSDNFTQVGTIADETGRIFFKAWADAMDEPQLEEGGTYVLNNVKTNKWNGNLSLQFQETSSLEAVDADVEAADNSVSVTGTITEMSGGAEKNGLIKRCSEEDCNRTLRNGRCSEHGEVEGEFDLRMMVHVNTGDDSTKAIISREATEELTGIDMETAQQMATDALDQTVVAHRMFHELQGGKFTFEGAAMQDAIYIPEDGNIEAADELTEDAVKDLVQTLRTYEGAVNEVAQQQAESQASAESSGAVPQSAD